MTCDNRIGGFDQTIIWTIEVYNHATDAWRVISPTRKGHPIEQINDQEVVWNDIVEDGSRGLKEVLNRYTGAIAFTGLGDLGEQALDACRS